MTLNNAPFAGDQKKGESFLMPLEKKVVSRWVTKVPSWLETYHLTFMTLPWCGFILLFSYLAKTRPAWLWLASLMVVFQYITDLFDGAVGRHRQTGLVKWGYYMDHFLDYIFLCSILMGYSFLLPDGYKVVLLILLAACGGLMVSSFLSFSVTNEFKISFLKFGPTETRILFILINTLTIFLGKGFLEKTVLALAVACPVVLFWMVFRTQRRIWAIDMENKKKAA